VTAEALPGQFTMSELVERTGVAAATVRYYLAAKLLPPPVKVAANRFLYDERHVELVRLVRLLRERRGLSLEAIGRLLPDLLPDLLGQPPGGVFRPEMWGQLLAVHTQAVSGPSAGERLLEAGLSAFSRNGYAEVTIDDVCRSAGIAKGSFYRHYASKEELFFAAAAVVGTRTAVAFAEHAGEVLLEAETAVALLADVLVPHVVIVLDLASLAARRRPGHGRVLRAVVLQVRDSVRAKLAVPGEPSVDGVLQRAFIDAVRRAAEEPAALAGIAELQVRDSAG